MSGKLTGSAPFLGPDGERRDAQVPLKVKSARSQRRSRSASKERASVFYNRDDDKRFSRHYSDDPKEGNFFRKPRINTFFRQTQSAPETRLVREISKRGQISSSGYRPRDSRRPKSSPGHACSLREAEEYVRRLQSEEARARIEELTLTDGSPGGKDGSGKDGRGKDGISKDGNSGAGLTGGVLITDLGLGQEEMGDTTLRIPRRDPRGATPAGRRATPGGRAGNLEVMGGNPPGRGGGRRLSVAALRRHTADRQQDVPRREQTRSPAEFIEWKYQLRLKLQRVFRLARFVVSMCSRMKEYSMSKTQESRTTQLYLYSANGAVEEEERVHNLFFDKSEYCRQRRRRAPLTVRAVAQKPVHMRTQDDVTALYGTLGNIKSFKDKYTEQMKGEMCKVAFYLSCETGRVILRQGQNGFNFYFIYSGSVFVQVSGIDPHTKAPFTSIVAVIPAGGAFGELALLGGRGLRTASIISREPTELFQIDKDAFLDICKDIYSAELEFKISVARQYPLFKDWAEDKMRELCFSSQIVNVAHGKLVERDWTNAKHIYFVLEGKIQLLQEIKQTRINEMTSDFFLSYKHAPSSSRRGIGNDVTTSGGSRFFIVGEMSKGDCSDLRILDPKRKHQVPRVILVSHGVKLLRMERTQVTGMAPKGSIPEVLEDAYTPIYVPDTMTLEERCTSLVNWDSYKQHVIKDFLATNNT